MLTDAVGNNRFRYAINIFERSLKHSLNPPIGLRYRLALLYDHYAQQCSKKNPKSARKQINRAEAIYQSIVTENPKYVLGWRGLAVVAFYRKNYGLAEKYAKQAFRLLQKMPRTRREALGIGGFYEARGKYEEAEKWYWQEYEACPRDSFGATSNLFRFYKEHSNLKKARRFALKLSRLMKTEFKKPQYRNLNVRRSKWYLDLEKDVNFVISKERGASSTPR